MPTQPWLIHIAYVAPAFPPTESLLQSLKARLPKRLRVGFACPSIDGTFHALTEQLNQQSRLGADVILVGNSPWAAAQVAKEPYWVDTPQTAEALQVLMAPWHGARSITYRIGGPESHPLNHPQWAHLLTPLVSIDMDPWSREPLAEALAQDLSVRMAAMEQRLHLDAGLPKGQDGSRRLRM